MQNRTVSRAQKGRIVPGPRIFQPRQPWLGAHSCLRGHIWLVTIRTSFSNQADIAIMCFWLKCAPLNNEFGSNVPPKTWKTSISALFLVIVHINTVCTYYALLSRVQLCRDYALFGGGTLGQNLLVGGTQTFLRTGWVSAPPPKKRNLLFLN